MKVSVIVPVYNVEAYLNKCLDSLLSQTLEEYEILVINDGSTDRSGAIADQYANKYDYLYVYHKENGGLSDARNYGISKAIGDYLLFIDSDDYVEDTMLEKMYNKAIAENLDIVVCDTILETSTSQQILHSNLKYSSNNIRSYIIAHPMACIRMIKKEIFNFVKFQKGIYYEDLHLMPILALYTSKIGFVEEAFYHYVQHEGSIMNQLNFHEKLLDIFLVTDHIYQSYKEKGKLEEYVYEIEYLYIVHLLRSATLRFLDYEGTNVHLERILSTMQILWPNWKKNPYLKKSSIKFRIICFLASMKQYWCIRLLKKI